MKFLKVLLACQVLIPEAAMAIKETHGGDIVFCQSPGEFEGYYNLDYIMTYVGSDDDILPVTSAERSMQRIAALLQSSVPELSESLTEFIELIGNRDPTRGRFWRRSALELIAIDSEYSDYQEIMAYLPANCYETSGDEVNITRAITRVTSSGLITYLYDANLIQELVDNDLELQLSFLYLHEWLRDYADSEFVIREVNRFLHSEIPTSPDYDLRSALNAFGLNIHPGSGFVEVCLRSAPVRDTLTNAIGETCDEITSVDLRRVRQLSLAHLGVDALAAGDLGGLSELERLLLNENGLEILPNDLFSGASAIYQLDLSDNLISEIPPSILAPLSNLEILDLSGNQLASVDGGIFVSKPRLFWVDASHNLLTELPSQPLSACPNQPSGTALRRDIIMLSFANNQIQTIPEDFLASFATTCGNTRLQWDANMVIDLRDNEISVVPASLYRRLRRLSARTGIGSEFQVELLLSGNPVAE